MRREGNVAASTERDRYIDWLRARGASDQDLEAHRIYAEKILDCVDDGPVQPADVDAAVEAERAAGAAESRLANVRRVGEFLQQFQRESPPSAPAAPEMNTDAFRPPKPEIDTADIELVTPRPRRPSSTYRMPVVTAPLRAAERGTLPV
ncbi:MAG TPA: hypothetical protein VMZ28_04630, partial [Kofleriaceae bacterium]|nr:hypothetical protein [Kofleriaceae bacterium]